MQLRYLLLAFSRYLQIAFSSFLLSSVMVNRHGREALLLKNTPSKEHAEK